MISEHFIPEIDNLLQDQHPLPAYCLKLLHACTEKFPHVIKTLLNRNLISTLLTMLQSHQGDINSSVLQSTIGIFNTFLSNKDVNFISLCKMGFIEYLTSAFIEVASRIEEDINTNSVSPLLLQLLDTLHHVYKNIELSVKNVLVNKLQTDGTSSKQDVEDLLQEGKALCEINGILINLLVFEDNDVQEWSSRCLYLSAELYGGEYEPCFTDDNLEYLCQAIRNGTRKRQKLLLRIIKRFVTSNSNLENIFKSYDGELKNVLESLLATENADKDGKNVRNVSAELLELLK